MTGFENNKVRAVIEAFVVEENGETIAKIVESVTTVLSNISSIPQYFSAREGVNRGLIEA